MRLVPSPTARSLVVALVASLTASILLAAPARAATPEAPGDFTGYAFDACVAPHQSVMDTWNLRSPYSAVGIYVSGSSRYCGDKHQPNLSKAWVTRNAANGWRFIPIHVGRQSPCFKNNPNSRVQKKKMSKTVSTARNQAVAEAKETIAALTKYGFGKGSVSYLDIEWYARTKACDTIVLEFADAWTEYLHSQGYKSGLYSSASAGIKLVDEARLAKRPGFTLPDHVWMAWGNKKADTRGGPYLSDSGWIGQRIHQYHLDVKVSYGGKALTIDKNYMDVGKGSVASKKARPCGARMELTRYPSLKRGDRRAEVRVLECLLRQAGRLKTVDETLGAGTVRAIDKYRKSRGWSQNGRASRPVWTALLSRGKKTRVLKYGSVGEPVWRLQRSLIAAGLRPRLTGVYDASTEKAVKAYRKARKLPQDPTVDAKVWTQLQRGRTA